MESIPARPKSYLYLTSFAVPNMLLDKISSLGVKDQINYCFIVSIIAIKTRKEKHGGHFQNIHSKVWVNFIGSDYARYPAQLTEWGIIETNPKFAHGNADPDNNFSKSFRWTIQAEMSGTVKKSFKEKVRNPFEDTTELVNDQQKWIYNNLKRLDVSDYLRQIDDVVDDVDAEWDAKKIFFMIFNLHCGKKVSRLYHTVLTMRKDSRRNLRMLKEAGEVIPQILYEYDVKSCHPVLCLCLMSDPTERAEYIDLLDGDLYTTIAVAMGVTMKREDLKTEYMRFLNGLIHNFFYEYYREHFPVFIAEIDKRGKKAMAICLQNMEADIMVAQVPLRLMEMSPKAMFVSMHDGWIGVERDEKLIAKQVRRLFYEATGYHITLTKENLETGEETVLFKGENARLVDDAPEWLN
jgi:hypothetical protein